MYGHSLPFHLGGGRGAAQPPQPHQIHLNPNNFPNPNFFHLQHPTLWPPPPPNPFLRNPTFPPIPPHFPYSDFPYQVNPETINVQEPPTNGSISNNVNLLQQHEQNEMIEKVDKAALSAQSELLESGENVSAWKVSQEALVKVRVDSWDSLGFQMQQVPYLIHLLGIERKVNAFIHCFVAARRITSLHDLEMEICESEGIAGFEELGLGPLLRHPVVVHYFSLSSDLTDFYRITTEEIIDFLCEFIDSYNNKRKNVDAFLDFVSKKKSVGDKEKLCVRVQDFNEYIDNIKRARQSEDRVSEKCFEKMKATSVKESSKSPLFNSKKEELDEHFTEKSQHMKSLPSKNTQFCGKHIRFASSSDDDDDDSEANEYMQNQNENNIESKCSLSLPNVTSDRVGGCPYPSATEEMKRLKFKNESKAVACGIMSNVENGLSQKRKRKSENMSSSTSLPPKPHKRKKSDEDPSNKSSGNEDTGGHSVSTESLKMFFTTWKEACQANSIDEVLEEMLQFYNTRKKQKARKMFASYPFVGLLCAAVTSIKRGMPDDICDTDTDTLQTLTQQSTKNDAEPVDPIAVKPRTHENGKPFSFRNHTNTDTHFNGGRDHGSSSSAQQQQAVLTGRLGEQVAFKYFVGKVGEPFVKWANEKTETGLPYDILLGGDDSSREYVEVKATKSGRKNWFLISMREWQFAIEKGESFSIAHVILAEDNMARVTVYKNPARLCQLGSLRLGIEVPRD